MEQKERKKGNVEKKSLKEKIFPIAIICLILVSCYTFWFGFMRGSDFSWTVQQDGYWNAVLEMGIAFWLFFVVIKSDYFKVKYKIGLSVIIYLIFAFLHAFFFAAIVGALYGVMIYWTGKHFGRLICGKDNKEYEEFHFRFVMGIASIIIIVGALSLLKQGTPEKLRVIFGGIFLIELFLERKNVVSFMKNIFLESENQKYKSLDSWSSIGIALICMMVTFITCRANMGIDYDSAWYGLRSQYVLAPYTGIFDKVILMACVYTYSKGIEVLSLPFAGLDSYSFLFAVNIMLGIMTLHAVYQLSNLTITKKKSLLFVCLLVLTPSFSNMMVTTKSDIATIYLQVVALLYAAQAIKNKNGSSLIAFFVVLLLSFGFKPSSIVFSGMMVMIFICFAILEKIKFKLKELRTIIGAFLAIVVLWGRTWLITGYPITSLVTSFFEKFNYYPKYPYSLPSSRTLSIGELFSTGVLQERLFRLAKIFFMPNTSDIYTLEVSWWGILFTVCWVSAILLIVFRPVKVWKNACKDRVYCFQIISFLACSAASLGCMLLLQTPDGNYFILLHVLTYWFIVKEIDEISGFLWVRIGSPLILSNYLLSVAISWSWMVGLTPIDIGNLGYYNHMKKYVAPYLESNNMTGVLDFCQTNGQERMIGFSDDEQALYALPTIIEGCVQQTAWASDTLESADALYDFMCYAEVDSILTEGDFLKNHMEDTEILLELAQNGTLQSEYNDENYSIFKVEKTSENTVDESAVQYFKALMENEN